MTLSPETPTPDPRPLTPDLIPPHGGELVDRYATPADAAAIRARAGGWESLALNPRQLADLALIANGAYSPLTGFLGQADFESVVARGRLASGVVWPIPVMLAVDDAAAGRLTPGDSIALRDGEGGLLGWLQLQGKYRYDKQEYARQVFRTTDESHPGVARLKGEGEWLLGGPVTLIRRPLSAVFPQYELDPAQTRAVIRQAGWRTVVGFQTRNPIHRAHEFILKSALELHDGLLIHPLVGETKGDDVPAEVRLRCYEALIENYYPKSRVRLAALPAVMRFAGPREALFHALIRKNHGCTHFIVGRDHAGVGNFYGPFDAQQIFDDYSSEELGIKPLRFENSFYCRTCQGMASTKTCPHAPEHHVSLSGTKVRALLAAGELPPPEFTRPEVAQVLIESYARPAA
jgi:ATP sulfurylase